MFEATIHRDPDRPFRLSGAGPYDLQVLRDHVLARARRGTRVEIRFPQALRPVLERVLHDVSRRGVELVLDPITAPVDLPHPRSVR